MKMPTPDAAVLQRRAEIVEALRQIVPGEGVIVSEPERRAYESDGLTAYRQLPIGRGAAVAGRRGRGGAALLQGDRRQGRAARRRHFAFGRGIAVGRRRAARHGQVQPHPRDRLRQSLRGGSARRHQSGADPGGRACRLLLRARSVEPDRLHDRRQCRRKFRRRALPQIRADHQQHPRRRAGADGWRDRPARRQAFRRRRLRSVGRGDRFRGAPGRRHRGHGAHSAQADGGARAADRVRHDRGCRQLRRRGDRRRHHSGRDGDDGPAGDPRRRGFCQCRLSARCRGLADRRARWRRRPKSTI